VLCASIHSRFTNVRNVDASRVARPPSAAAPTSAAAVRVLPAARGVAAVAPLAAQKALLLISKVPQVLAGSGGPSKLITFKPSRTLHSARSR
jgi:hypothetical protein